MTIPTSPLDDSKSDHQLSTDQEQRSTVLELWREVAQQDFSEAERRLNISLARLFGSLLLRREKRSINGE